MQGDQAAYIAGARWVVPAAVMFQEALVTGLEGGAAHLRIVRPGDAGAVLGVRVDVRRFETDYEGGRPVVAIDAVVQVTSAAGLAQSERLVSIRTPASENRVSAIVAAYDAAMARVIDGAAEAISAAPAAAR